jgi:hypothetical protein
MISNSATGAKHEAPYRHLQYIHPSVVERDIAANQNVVYRKPRNHRKRYIPAGPAGVWFQTLQQQKIQNQIEERRRNQNDSMTNQENVEDEDIIGTQMQLKTDKQQANKMRNNEPSSCYSPAWTAVQCDLGFATPNCSPWLSSSQRYSMMRPFVPEHIVLIREMSSMQNIWKLPTDRKMLVMVHNIQALLGDHYLWSATLTDETGSFIQAWLQPSLVQKEQQLPTPQYLRLGVVWMLSEVTFQLIFNESGYNSRYRPLLESDEDEDDDNDDTDENEHIPNATCRGSDHELMMLVAESNIEKLWSAASEKDISNDVYIQWMEKKNAATLVALESFGKRSVSRTDVSNAGNKSTNACSNEIGYAIDDNASHCSSSTEEAEFVDMVQTIEPHVVRSRKRLNNDMNAEDENVSIERNRLMHLRNKIKETNVTNHTIETPSKIDPHNFITLQTKTQMLTQGKFQESTSSLQPSNSQKSDDLSAGPALVRTNPYSKLSGKFSEEQQPGNGEYPLINFDHMLHDSPSNQIACEQVS